VNAYSAQKDIRTNTPETGRDLVGRVCFNLAENRNDAELLFAFLATTVFLQAPADFTFFADRMGQAK
jgi:hypothetical protein